MLNISKELASKRIAYIDDRLSRYPDHPNKATLLSEREKYAEVLGGSAPEPPQDRLLNRVEALVTGARKLEALIAEDSPNKARLEERLAEYKQSLTNIQEFGREKMPTKPEGVKIDVPADLLTVRGN